MLLITNRKISAFYILLTLLLAVVAFMIYRYGILPLLGVVIVFGALASMFIWPEAATLVVAFVLYANLVPVAAHFHGVPRFAAASVVLLLSVPLANFLIVRRQGVIIDRVFVLMLLFLLVLLVSSIFAKDLSLAGERIGRFVLEGLFLYLLVVNVIRSYTTLRRVIWALILAGGLLGGLSLFQALTHSYGQQFGGLAYRNLKYEEEAETREEDEVAPTRNKMRLADRAQGPIEDPNRYAQLLLVVLPLAVFRFWDERSRWLRLCAGAVSGLILCGVLLSYSRGAFLTLAFLFLLMALMRLIRTYRIVVLVVAALIMIGAVAPGYYDRMRTIAAGKALLSRETVVRPDAVTRERADSMMASLMVFLEHPLVGVGPGQYAPFYSASYQLDPDNPFRYSTRRRRAHTLYFEIGAETGLIGLAVFMWIVVRVLYRLHGARRRLARCSPDLRNIATAFGLSVIAYLGTGIFLHLSYERYYWLLLALSTAAVRIINHEALSRAEIDVVGLAHEERQQTQAGWRCQNSAAIL